MSNVVIFTTESVALTFTDKKGSMHAITAEGACFKGGAAMAALKDHALESALIKATSGRYRAAADILAAAFPSIAKAGEKFTGTALWANKASFVTFVTAILTATPKDEAKGWSAKQSSARMLCNAYIRAITPAEAPAQGDVVENNAEQPATV